VRTQSCNTEKCPFFSSWSTETPCTVSCGGGELTIARKCSVEGACDGPLVRVFECNTQPCPAAWSPWFPDGSCSKKCGGGTMKMVRVCSQPDKCSNEADSKQVQCNTGPCGEYSPWAVSGSCSVTCGEGEQMHVRRCTNGLQCEGDDTKFEPCSSPIPCTDGATSTWTSWSGWSECSKTCGPGLQTRFRGCSGPVNSCNGQDYQERSCAKEPYCPLVWGAWSSCSKSCGAGTRTRMRCKQCRMEFEDCEETKCPRKICTTSELRRPGSNSDRCCDTTGLDENSCGVNSIQGRIIGGNEAEKGSWPWLAKLTVSFKLCGANLIDDRWVVTAAHCLRGATLSNLKLQFGMHDRRDTSKQIQTRYAKRFIMHPKFKFPHYDIGLIELREPIVRSAFVSPICLPQGEEIPVDATCRAAGWGVVELKPETIAHKLQEVELRVLSPKVCEGGYGTSAINATSVVCAGRVGGGKDTCGGDSGGPLMCQRCTTCQWMLFGLTSFGSAECGKAKAPGVYTKLEPYSDWINQQVGRNIAKAEQMESCSSL